MNNRAIEQIYDQIDFHNQLIVQLIADGYNEADAIWVAWQIVCREEGL